MTDFRQSAEYARFMEQIGWSIAEIGNNHSPTRVFIRHLPIVGSIIKIQRPPPSISFEEVDKLAKEHKAVIVKLELVDQSLVKLAESHQFKPDNWPLIPTKTIRIDITPSLEEILTQMKKDARYELRKINSCPLQLIEVEDLSQFRRVWKQSSHWKRWIPPEKHLGFLKNDFKSEILFLIATHSYISKDKLKDSDILVGSTIIFHNKTAFYHFAFSSKEGKKLSVPYFLVWEIIKLAKERNCEVFDFEGIFDPRFKETESWKGFTHFKRSFGGQEIEYPGPFIKYYNPILRFLANLKLPNFFSITK